MGKVIAVFGATGTIGTSVAQSLLRDPSNFQVRAVTRDPTKPQATALADQGAVVIKADADDRESLVPVLQGAHGCFVATSVPLSNPMCQQLEYQQGQNIADVCMSMKVEHVILHAQNHVSKVIGLKARHCDAKASINDYMRAKGLPLTSVILPFAYENFLGDFRPQRLQQHEFSIAIPMGDHSLNMLSIKQVGEAARYIFANHATTLGKTFSLVGDKLTVREIASIFSNHLRPYTVKDAQVTLPEFQSRTSSHPGNEDITNVFDFQRKVTQRFSIDTTMKLIPDLLTFDQWVAQNKETILKVILDSS